MYYNLQISLYQIRLFTAAAESRSFPATSAMFHTTQSAVSKSIASMGSILDFPLLVCNRSTLELTEAGKYLYQQWENHVFSVESAVIRAKGIDQIWAQTLTVGIPDSLENWRELDYAAAMLVR